jgi:hypothetical protein
VVLLLFLTSCFRLTESLYVGKMRLCFVHSLIVRVSLNMIVCAVCACV